MFASKERVNMLHFCLNSQDKVQDFVDRLIIKKQYKLENDLRWSYFVTQQ